MHYFKNLYIFFIIVASIISFFSTTNVKAKAFQINDIEISKPFEEDFNKNIVINIGFRKAFFELIGTIVKSTDLKKIDEIKLNQIKSMIESFSIKEEKFINQTYYVNLGVAFDKKKIFNYLERNNIYPSQIIEETFLFIPIIIDENINDLSIFSNNQIYNNWNKSSKKTELINYLLPSEDLEDMSLIKSKIDVIESYDFEEILEKYFLNHSIITLIFRSNNEIKVLSKININEITILKNYTFENISLDNKNELEKLINQLKLKYEDLWKNHNQINTSIKLLLTVMVDNKDLNISSRFESTLDKIDLINDYSIKKFDKDNIFYEIIFNGTPKNFIHIMNKNNYNFDTQKKIWILK